MTLLSKLLKESLRMEMRILDRGEIINRRELLCLLLQRKTTKGTMRERMMRMRNKWEALNVTRERVRLVQDLETVLLEEERLELKDGDSDLLPDPPLSDAASILSLPPRLLPLQSTLLLHHPLNHSPLLLQNTNPDGQPMKMRYLTKYLTLLPTRPAPPHLTVLLALDNLLPPPILPHLPSLLVLT